MGRPKEHDEATRERLLEAAEQLSASKGWEFVTVRGVADQAGTSTRAVYALFDSKEGLEQAFARGLIVLPRASHRLTAYRNAVTVHPYETVFRNVRGDKT